MWTVDVVALDKASKTPVHPPNNDHTCFTMNLKSLERRYGNALYCLQVKFKAVSWGSVTILRRFVRYAD